MELWETGRSSAESCWYDAAGTAGVTGQPVVIEHIAPEIVARERGRASVMPVVLGLMLGVMLGAMVISTGLASSRRSMRARKLGRLESVRAGYPRGKQGRKAFICAPSRASM